MRCFRIQRGICNREELRQGELLIAGPEGNSRKSMDSRSLLAMVSENAHDRRHELAQGGIARYQCREHEAEQRLVSYP